MNGPAPQTGGSTARPVVEQCLGCDRILKEAGGQRCSAFAFPDTKWRLGACSMATHIKADAGKGAEKVRVGQQKQKKR
jgi:hypothetical protein